MKQIFYTLTVVRWMNGRPGGGMCTFSNGNSCEQVMNYLVRIREKKVSSSTTSRVDKMAGQRHDPGGQSSTGWLIWLRRQ
ncbi:hypothetical protein T02_5242 [Trichinella nativa]|uniref:Uncharacterized protein n=1 Tax=Trichinella nativa TaxID=6335 RepID=A0A0V1LN18_9BILA|nr:hypothetical protein T02_5242 [Trichinella nativa]